MEECAKDPNQNELETKPKKNGFFRRLKRGFTSIFQRKTHRKRNKSEPCLPGIPDESTKPDGDNEARLSLDNDENTEKPEENGENLTSGSPPFRPVAKAPIFVNDFTAELKKSLLQRSKMVEEGQTSEAIVQIEMTRSNYSTNEEENQAEIENKTFEEKVALFESQISGGSLHNSLKRNSKLSDNKQEILEDEKEDASTLENFNENFADKESNEKVALEILEVDDKVTTINSDVEEVEFDNHNDGFTNYELTISKDEEQIKDEETKNEETNSLKEVNDIKDDFNKILLSDDETIQILNKENDLQINFKENDNENRQTLSNELESQNCVDVINNGILMDETNSV